MRKIYAFIIAAVLHFSTNLYAQQVTVSATAGDPLRNYTTLTAAFDAINLGTHQGTIVVSINANTNEGTTSATLNSSDADPCNYTSIIIRPTADGIIVSGAPASGFGVIQLNGADNVTINGDNAGSAGTNRNLTINNTAATTVTFGSVIRVATSAGVTSADNINIFNLNLNGNVVAGNASAITSATGSSNQSFGIYCGGNAGTSPILPPTAITSETANPAPVGTIIKSLNVDNNSINQCGRGIVFNGAAASISTGFSISNNIIGGAGALGGYPFSAVTNTVYTKGIWVAGSEAVSITNNTLRSITSFVATAIVGIELNANIGLSNIDISNNILTGIASNATSTADGVLVSSAGNLFSINGNTITSVHNGGANMVTGITIATTGGAANITNNKITDVFNHNTGGWPAKGINLSTAANGCLIQNNFISNIMNVGASSFPNTFNVNGILLNSGNDHKVYHNSVNIYGNNNSTSTNSMSCLAITANTQTGIDIRNNIFSNTATSNFASDANTCLFLPFVVSSGMNLTLNHNAYYTGSIAGKSGIAFAGATTYALANVYDAASFVANETLPLANFRSFSTLLGVLNNDYASFASTASAPFVSANDLHILNVTTQLKSGGIGVGATTDIDVNPRNTSYPDMGADEFTGTNNDLTAPLIVYTPLTSTCTPGIARDMDVTITDRAGVPTAGAGLPMLYWRINAGAYTGVQATSLGGGVYRFNFGAGTILTDVVTYFVVAEDNSGNVISSPNAGASGHTASAPDVATPPTSPQSYTLQGALPAGTYNVGVGQVYTTLTAAVNAYNNSCLSGPIIFQLMDAIYPSETFPITINNNAFSSITNTLTIRPNAGLSVNFNGDNALALIKLNGADYVTLEGVSAGSSWLLTNTNTGTSSATIWLASSSLTDGANNNTIRNLRISGSGTASSIGGIIAGSGSTFGSPASSPNSNNSITGNAFVSAQNGIFINGHSSLFDQNWVITNNTFGSAIVSEKLGFRGLSLQRVNNYTISGNTITGVFLSSASPATGIAIFNNATNGNIFNNKISDIRQNSASGAAYGIQLANTSNTAAVRVYNNFVSAVSATGSATVANNGFGIILSSGGGYNLYYNSVSMNLDQTAATSTTAAIHITAGITTSNTLDIRNNIFSNTQAQASPRFAIYSAATSSVYGSIDYNNYYKGTSAFLGFLGSNRALLSDWQAATGKDAKSASAIPLFIDPGTNLHLQLTSTLNGLGQPIAGITNDIDVIDVRDATIPDMGADEFFPALCTGTPSGGSVSSPVTSFCVSGSTTITAAGFTTGSTMVYQWEFSTVGAGGPWNPLVGQTTPTSASINISVTTWFRLRATCNNSGLSGSSAAISISVNSPSISSTTPGVRCGTGTIDLDATSATGTLTWYGQATGGSPLGTGTTFTTPVISTTTQYYVSASVGGTTNTVGAINTSISTSLSSQTTTTTGINFDINGTGVNIVSMDIYPTAAIGAAFTITVRQGTTVITSFAGTTTVSGTTGAPVVQTVPVNFSLVPGSYTVTMTTNPGIIRNSGGTAFPYTVPGVISLTSSTLGGFYYNFYNWVVTSGCESPRTQVTATVNPAPAITATASPTAICVGQSSTLTATSANPTYIYAWTPGPLPGGSPITVTPAATTTYTLSAFDAGSGCAATATTTVTVNALPGIVTVTPALASICAGGNVPITASGGSINGVVDISSGVISLPIPDANTTGISNTLAVAGIPAGAVVDSIIVTVNIPISFVSDIIANLEAPNGQVINLISGIPVNANDNFTNTRITSNDIFPAVSSGTAPFTGTFRADKAANASLLISPIPNVTTTTWAPLYSILNGNWRIRCYDDDPAIVGSLTNWQIKIHYSASAAFTWSPAAGLSATTGPSVTASPTVNTVYTVTATNAAGCVRNATSTINVTTGIISAVTTAPICAGQNATLNVAFTGSAPWTFTYTANGGSPVTVTTSTNPHVITVAPTVTTNYQLTNFTNVSCNINAPNLPAIATITVQPAPPVTITPSSASICETGVVTLTAGGATSYTWTGPNLSSTTGNPVTATPPIGSNAYSVIGTDGNGCTATIGTSVTVNPNLPVTVNVTTPATTVCSGASVTFTANTTNPGTGTPYQWQVNNVNQGAPTASNTFVYTPVNGDVIRVIVTSNALCATGTPATSTGVTMTVSGSTTASVTLSSTGALCSGSVITFTANPVSGGASPNFEFFVNSSSVQNGAAATYIYTPTNGDNVYVIMTSSLTCATGSPATSTPITVSFFAAPTTAPTSTCLSLRAGNTAILSSNAAAGSGSITGYQWYLVGTPDVALGTAATQSVTAAGTYYVIISNSNGCSTTSANVVITAATGALPGGIYTINPVPVNCNNFTSINNAALYLNQYGVGGAVTFNIAGGYTETAPLAGISLGSATLNATLSAANTLLFQKQGAGANPRITAFTPQTNASVTDAVIKIIGADYVTFDAIDVSENAANTTANIMTEFGYGLFYISVTDGASNNTIRNAVITMNKTNVNTFGIYSNVRHAATSNANVDITALSGNNDNLRIYGNTISNVNTGIMVVSPVGLPGTGLDIGGTALSTGNNISDFGALNAGLAGVPTNTSGGIAAVAQYPVNISYNTLASANGAIVSSTLRGIFLSGGVLAGGSANTSINNNNISLRVGTAAGIVEGIRNDIGNANLNLSISNNDFNNFTNTAGSPTGAVTFIINSLATLSQNLNANTFTNLSINSTGNLTFISNAVALPASGVQNVNNNIIVTGFTKTGVGGTIVFYQGGTGSNAASVINNNNNNFSNLTFTGSTISGWVNGDITANTKTVNTNTFNSITNNTSGNITILNITGSPNVAPGLILSGNTVTNITTNGPGTIAPIIVGLGVATKSTVTLNTVTLITSATTLALTGINVGSGGASLISSNSVTGITANGAITGLTGPIVGTASTMDLNIIGTLVSTGAGGNVIGISSSTPAGTAILNSNTVSGLSSTGINSTITGIQSTQAGNVFDNTVHNLSSSGTSSPFVNGILIGAGTSAVYKNRVYNISNSGALASGSIGTVSGIQLFTGGTATATVYNNYISDLRASNASNDNSVRAINVNSTAGTQTYNLYYNTVYLNAAGAGDFGATGIYQNSGATSTVVLRNNIISNESTPSGAGRVVAYRRANAIGANYGAATNNNLLYAGVPSANRLVYFDGTNSDQTMTAFQARVAPRDALSVSHKPTFLNIAATPYDLRVDAVVNCSLDGTGDNTGILIADDYEGTARQIISPFITDIGADEFIGTGGSAGVWKGINSNWMDVANWCDAVPNSNTNVVIPFPSSFYPVITTTAPVARNLTIAAGANITINAAATISLKGNVANSGTITNNGNIVLNGNTAQTFPGAAGTIAAMNSVEVNNAAGATFDKELRISSALLPTLGTITLNNVEVTMASTATATARVGAVGTNNAFVYTGSGRFIIERYIPNHNKAWQLLATPASGQTVNQAWQEGNTFGPPPTNTSPGFGTIITGATTAQGFDIATPLGATIKRWNAASLPSGAWDNLTSTLNPIADPKGYMLMVRGERGVYVNQTPSTATTLRTRGRIAAPGGADAPALVNVPAGKVESIGNPYASAIDFTLISKTNVDNKFYVWDPTISGLYGLGGFQTFAAATGWLPTVGGSAIYPAATPVQVIQSGQAFMVMSSGPAGTVTFAEANKVAGSQTTFRLNTFIKSINAGLTAVNGSVQYAADGNVVVFDPAYSNEIDADDALKLVNTGENFGIARSTKKLVIDARQPVSSSDTIFYVFNNLRTQGYQLKFAPQNMYEPGLDAFLIDNFAGSRTPVSLSDSTFVDFAISSDPLSSRSDRFMLVFKKIPPVSYTTIEGLKKGHDVEVTWKVTNEVNIDKYEIERSTDGINFTKMAVQSPRNNGTSQYMWLDQEPKSGMNYYRIRSVSVANDIRYSEIVSVKFEAPAVMISVYPNPIKNDKLLNINLSNQLKGKYAITIISSNGETVERLQVDHPGRTGIYPLRLNGVFAHGTYMVTITDPLKNRTTFKIVY